LQVNSGDDCKKKQRRKTLSFNLLCLYLCFLLIILQEVFPLKPPAAPILAWAKISVYDSP
jgi:K+-transporting ATPase A subunit